MLNIKINDQFDSEIIKAVHEINTKLNGRLVFGGSFGLKYYGLLDRIINDLDVFTMDYYYGSKEAETELNRQSSGRFYVNGIEVFCVHGQTTNGIFVDYFYKDVPLEFDVISFHGQEIKIEKPEIAIKAKEQYTNNNSQENFNLQKHRDDLAFIAKASQKEDEPYTDDLPF